jgi:hypothetical protein
MDGPQDDSYPSTPRENKGSVGRPQQSLPAPGSDGRLNVFSDYEIEEADTLDEVPVTRC